MAMIDDTFVKIFVFLLGVLEFPGILQLKGLLLINNGIHNVSIVFLQFQDCLLVFLPHLILLLFQSFDFLPEILTLKRCLFFPLLSDVNQLFFLILVSVVQFLAAADPASMQNFTLVDLQFFFHFCFFHV